jgi:hypothetical protein
MIARLQLRRLLHVLVAAGMVSALLHGPSMAYADTARNAVHLSPHHDHTHHMSGHDSDQSVPAMPAEHQHDAAGAMPGCPLANFAAVAPIAAPAMSPGRGEPFDAVTLPVLTASDPLLADPPPRAVA